MEEGIGGSVPTSLLERVMPIDLRRTHVPRELEKVTDRGAEAGPPEAVAAIWDRVEDLYRTGMHPGVQVCIRHRGAVVLDRAIGHARGNEPGRRFDSEAAQPMRTDTPINLFSAAKAISAMVVHKIEEQQALSLDDTVARHLPGFERHGKGGITIRQVLSHRAGLPNMPAEAFDLDLLTDPDRIEALVCNLKPEGRRGGPPAYDAVVGGFVLEAVCRRTTGRSMRDVLATEIRDPLGLEWFDLGVAAEDVGRVARNVETGFPLLPPLDAFFRRVLGKDWSEVLELSNDPRFLSGVIPSGNAIVTARDAATFYQCLLEDGSLDGARVFRPETVARARKHHGRGVPIDRRLLLPMRYSPGFMLGAYQVSLFGWNHPRIFGHIGMSNLWTWADPDRDLVVALLTTGKPVIGTHLLALPALISEIHAAFPARS